VKYSIKLPNKTSCSMVIPWSISLGIPWSLHLKFHVFPMVFHEVQNRDRYSGGSPNSVMMQWSLDHGTSEPSAGSRYSCVQLLLHVLLLLML